MVTKAVPAETVRQLAGTYRSVGTSDMAQARRADHGEDLARSGANSELRARVQDAWAHVGWNPQRLAPLARMNRGVDETSRV